MRRITTATAVPNKFGVGKPGFTNGDPASGLAATDLDAEFFDGLQESILRVQEEAGFAPDDDPNQFLEAIIALINARSSGHSISALPTSDIGAITVIEAEEIWRWSVSAFFTGYRSQLCGRAVLGHTTAPLPCEIDATGGLLPKSAYARLWGYARENGLVVTQAVWTANIGAHYFVDVDATFFRCPDLRNMFPRFTGTDADTANARALGSKQLDAFQGHAHNVAGSGTTFKAGGDQPTAGVLVVTTTDVVEKAGYGTPRVSKETRPISTAYHPRIHA